jgi:membrane associated rhomboid family serine protease
LIPIGDGRRWPGFPVVVYLLIACNVYVFIQELGAPDIDRFINLYATIPFDITHGVVLPPPSPAIPALTILTAMFLHASLVHIGFNMLFLFVFGPEIEYVCGHVGFAVLYVLCGVAGGALQIAISPGSHVPELGASGAIGIWAAIQFASGFGSLSERLATVTSGTAYFVHIGGFACGVIAIGLFRRRDAGTRGRPGYS